MTSNEQPGESSAIDPHTRLDDRSTGARSVVEHPPRKVRRGPGGRTSDPDFMLSLARGLQVTSALARRKRPSTVSQLSLDTGLARSVVRRCLHTLTQVGLAGQDDRRHFFLRSDVQWRVDAPRLR